MILMKNVKILRDSLVENNWHITAFPFSFNDVKCTVLFEVLSNFDPKNKNIVHLTFIDLEDTRRTLEADANSARIDIDISEIHHYFHINSKVRYKDFILSFYKNFNRFIPLQFKKPDNESLHFVVDRLNKRDKAEGYLCYSVKRNSVSKNGVQGRRSIYNDNKARLLRPELYKLFYKDDTISFVFGDREANDADILKRFSEKEKNNI